jgi:hypothetical protein
MYRWAGQSTSNGTFIRAGTGSGRPSGTGSGQRGSPLVSSAPLASHATTPARLDRHVPARQPGPGVAGFDAAN